MLRALTEAATVEVELVTFHDVMPQRRKIGWIDPDFGAAKRVRNPTPAELKALISRHDSPRTLHIFSGIQAFPSVYRAFRMALRTDARIGVISLQPDPRGLRGVARWALYKTHAWRYARDVDLFLALGEGAAAWYRNIGFRTETVYVFGNFTGVPATTPFPREPRSEGLVISFVGELIKRKSVDVLLRALAHLKERSWTLRVVGDGPYRPQLERLAESLGIGNAIQWSAFQPHSSIFAALSEADLLVLPSAFDGWGFVVNEALIIGVPVICSDACGAAEVVRRSGHGAVFATGEVASLQEVLQREIAKGSLGAEKRRRLSTWALCIGAEAGAAYFLSILESAFGSAPRPLPPWTGGV